jgi:fumarate reductase flavoprotein subunit
MGNMIELVVIGGGLAGLSCAARAAELGASVVVFEQGTEEQYPCNSRYSGGMFHLDYRDIDTPTDALAASLLRECPDDVNRVLVEVIARNARRAVAWLEAHAGARFVRVGPQAYEKWVLAPPRPPKPGLVHPGRGPDVILNNLAAVLGDAVQRGARAVGVARNTDGFEVTTVQNGKVSTTATRALAFCDGGFQANAALVTQHVTDNFAQVLQRNAGTGRGFCLEAGRSLGAALSELKSFYGHLVARDALQNPELWPYPMIDGLAKASVLVGADGKRFADEGHTGVYLANQVARCVDPLGTTVVFDSETWWSTGRETRVPPNPVLTNRGGRLYAGDSIDGLATHAGIDAAGLRDTIGKHNHFVRTGDATALDVPRRTGATRPRPIVRPPFYAVPVCAGITYTMGGLLTSANAEVRATRGGIIAGLYAAGAAVGGIEGGERNFYLGGLCKALVLGLISAESAVAYLQEDALRRPAATRL